MLPNIMCTQCKVKFDVKWTIITITITIMMMIIIFTLKVKRTRKFKATIPFFGFPFLSF